MLLPPWHPLDDLHAVSSEHPTVIMAWIFFPKRMPGHFEAIRQRYYNRISPK
jgi:hypothetical protein